jgi:hypothetical protein
MGVIMWRVVYLWFLFPLIVLTMTALLVARDEGDPVGEVVGPGEIEAVVSQAAEVPLVGQATVTIWRPGSTQLKLAGSTEGIITAVHLEPGETVSHGSPVANVSGATVIAARTPSPFYRPIGPFIQGEDVRELAEMLSSFGYLAEGEVGDVADIVLVRAIDRFFRATHHTAEHNAVFDPSWVLWLPIDHGVVEAVGLHVGDPATGSLAAVSAGPITMTVARADGTPISEESWADTRVLRVDGSPAPPQAASLADLREHPEVLLQADSGSDQSIAPAPAGEPPGDEPIVSQHTIEVDTGEVLAGVVLPLTAILGPEGDQCVILRSAGGEVRTAPIDVIGDTSGRPVVRGLPDDVQVLATPDPLEHSCADGD